VRHTHTDTYRERHTDTYRERHTTERETL